MNEKCEITAIQAIDFLARHPLCQRALEYWYLQYKAQQEEDC